MIHKVNDKFAIIMEKTMIRKDRAASMLVCISHCDSAKVKTASIAYLKVLKALTSEDLVSNIKVDHSSACCTEITYDVSDIFEVNMSDAKEELMYSMGINLISI